MTTLNYSAAQAKAFCDYIVANGQLVDSRLGPTYELLHASFTVSDDVICTDLARGQNHGFCLAEFASLVTGVDDIRLFTRYIKSYDRFSTDGLTLDDAYGKRVAPHLESLIDLLSRSPDARTAVLTINDTAKHMLSTSNHVPCTLSIQFLVRNKTLHMQVNMRSNDAVLGVMNDVIVFRLLQCYVARRLSLGLGKYTQTAGSLHVYAKDLPKIANWPETMLSDCIRPWWFGGASEQSMLRLANMLKNELSFTPKECETGADWMYEAIKDSVYA